MTPAATPAAGAPAGALNDSGKTPEPQPAAKKADATGAKKPARKAAVAVAAEPKREASPAPSAAPAATVPEKSAAPAAAKPGTIVFHVSAAAELWIDGVKIGDSNSLKRYNVQPGTHRVEVRHCGFPPQDFIRNIDVVSDQSYPMDARCTSS